MMYREAAELLAEELTFVAPPNIVGQENHTAKVEPGTLAETLATFRKWLHLPDTGALEVLLAAYVANRMKGDPVWLLTIAPPGSGKTELVVPFASLADVHMVAVLTEASLLSGTPKRDHSKDAKGGLLNQLGQFGILCVKDFGGLMSMHKDTVGPVMAALREVFDGSWTRYVGADSGKQLTWSGKAGLIGGATPAIDGAYRVMASLGERFVFYRMPDEDREVRAKTALQHWGEESIMRAELSGAIRRLMAGIDFENGPMEISDTENDWLVTLANLAVICRSPVDRDTMSPNREISYIPGAESPTRMVKTLVQLFSALRIIGCERERSWTLVRKVALDSMPQLRQQALELVAAEKEELTTGKTAAALGYPTNTVRRALEDLTAYRVLERDPQGRGLPDVWQFSSWAREAYSKTATVPQIWQGDIDAGGPGPINIDIYTTQICGTPPIQTCPSCGSTAQREGWRWRCTNADCEKLFWPEEDKTLV